MRCFQSPMAVDILTVSKRVLIQLSFHLRCIIYTIQTTLIVINAATYCIIHFERRSDIQMKVISTRIVSTSTLQSAHHINGGPRSGMSFGFNITEGEYNCLVLKEC